MTEAVYFNLTSRETEGRQCGEDTDCFFLCEDGMHLVPKVAELFGSYFQYAYATKNGHLCFNKDVMWQGFISSEMCPQVNNDDT